MEFKRIAAYINVVAPGKYSLNHGVELRHTSVHSCHARTQLQYWPVVNIGNWHTQGKLRMH